MKKQIKNGLLITLVIASLISCKQSIPKEVIDGFKTDNSFYEKDMNKKISTKEEILKDADITYKNFLPKLDPKKKAAFEKDKEFHRALEYNKSCLIELAEKNQTTSAFLKEAIATSNLFVASLDNSDLTEEEATKKMTEYSSGISKLQYDSESIENQMLDNKTETHKLYITALKKYGIPAKLPSKKKK
ncbi:MAG: hypothetical protein JNJ41_20165 [Bacteroidia bacterium]|nr:hypothetical protein [Bacteroidia bacterium]MDO9001159.1 hypothetical protein [Bacteroidota bacterium]MDP3145590.1 hypothetical protein [Bacteroidota bacterium]